ncbi:MAG: energy transducer TonB [Bacteroidia bacterium]|nr:energy transducer TonB [Bacteroidia bacterium]
MRQIFFVLILIFLLAPVLPAQPAQLKYGHKPADFDGTQRPTEQAAELQQPLELRYPEAAASRNIEGVAIVAAWIDEKGYVAYAEVTKGSGYGMLDSAALDAVVAGDFKAAKRSGLPVASRVSIPVEFRLRRVSDEYDAAKSSEELEKEREELRRAKEMLEAEQRQLEEELRRLKEQQEQKKK